jgi:hypothetical protein
MNYAALQARKQPGRCFYLLLELPKIRWTKVPTWLRENYKITASKPTTHPPANNPVSPASSLSRFLSHGQLGLGFTAVSASVRRPHHPSSPPHSIQLSAPSSPFSTAPLPIFSRASPSPMSARWVKLVPVGHRRQDQFEASPLLFPCAASTATGRRSSSSSSSLEARPRSSPSPAIHHEGRRREGGTWAAAHDRLWAYGVQ